MNGEGGGKKSKMRWLNKTQDVKSLRIVLACNSFCLKCKHDRMWLTSEPNPSLAEGIARKVRGFMRISVILSTPEPCVPGPKKVFQNQKGAVSRKIRNGKSHILNIYKR